MKKQVKEEVILPEGVHCTVEGKNIKCSKGGAHVVKAIPSAQVKAEVKGDRIVLSTESGNKRIRAIILSMVAHINNMFRGLEEKFVYEMEICNVHFPMTVKIEGNQMIINNFLGEKVKRIAQILPGVAVEIKGTKVLVSGADVEAVGQTVANIERSTLVKYRDRRVFQDGIFLTAKSGRAI